MPVAVNYALHLHLDLPHSTSVTNLGSAGKHPFQTDNLIFDPFK